MNPTLNVRILSPKGLIFSDQAFSVSSKNSAGDFDILPFHANLISFIENQPILINTSGGKRFSFKFPFAIIYTSQNRVNIYTDIPQELKLP